MIKKILFIFMCASFANCFNEQENYSVEDLLKVSRGLNGNSNLVTPVFYTDTIKQKDLNQAAITGNAMYKITRPGNYYVASDLTFTPQNNNVIGIEIAASNVTLNLNTKTLNHNSNSQAQFNLIKLDGGNTNIIIKNGKLISDGGSNSSLARAIMIDRASSVVSYIICTDLLINLFNWGGIIESGASTTLANGLKISNVLITQINGNSSTDANACSILYRDYVEIENSSLNNNQNTNANRNVNALVIQNCKDIKLINCNANNNLAAYDCYPYKFQNNSTSEFTNCNCIENIAQHNQNCFYFASCNSGTMQNCNSNKNTGAFDTNGFIFLTCNSITFKNCKCLGLTNSGSSAATLHGFYMSSCNAFDFSNCDVSNLLATANEIELVAYYINNSNNFIYRDCKAQNNNNTNPGMYFHAFLCGVSNYNIFDNCTVVGNKGNDVNGINFAFSSKYNIAKNCKVYSNSGVNVYGLNIYDSNFYNIYINNQIYDNIGSTLQYGYFDNSGAGTTNWIAKNIAYGQGISQVITGAPTYNSNKCNYFPGRASISTGDFSNFIKDVPIQQILTLDTNLINWTNVSGY